MAHPIAAAFRDVPAQLRLVSCIGAQWPAELSTGDWKVVAPDRLLKKLSSRKQRQFWLGYISPVDLLLQQQPSHAAGLEQLLHDWLDHTSTFLEAHTSAPTRTRLINLSHQPPLAGEQAPLSPDRLPLPLQLYLQKRCDVLDRYADLEAQADLLGRQPEFVLSFASPTTNDWKALLLQAWEAQAMQQLTREREEADADLQGAREEAELTLLQLHQVQEELEHYFLRSRSSDQLAEEQAARIQALEESAVQLTREREEADAGLQGAREEAELTLLQLHQVQEELEHYFLHSRSSDQLAGAQAEQNRRAFSLIGRMLRLYTVPA